MLTPEYLSRVAEGAENIASNLHEYIIKQIIDRMMIRMGRGENYILTSRDAWQIQVLQDAGYLLSDIIGELAKYTRMQEREIRAAMEDAGVTALKADALVYERVGLSCAPLNESPELIRLMNRNYRATLGEWENYTRTTANAAQTLFINECDDAYNKVVSGATTYTQAVSEAVQNIAAGGVQTVYYPSGHKDTIEVATARAVRTGISQATAEITETRMEELDWDIVLVSAHVGARTGDGGENPGNHSWWQGKFYSRTGRDTRFPPFKESTGYGTGEGLCGWNCRHSFGSGDGENNPYEDLREQNEADAGETEKKEQRQRALERRIRKTKREVVGMQEAVEKCQDEALKAELQGKLDRESYVLKTQNTAYTDYCKENGLRTQSERLQIAQWTREAGSKSIAAAKRYEKDKL